MKQLRKTLCFILIAAMLATVAMAGTVSITNASADEDNNISVAVSCTDMAAGDKCYVAYYSGTKMVALRTVTASTTLSENMGGAVTAVKAFMLNGDFVPYGKVASNVINSITVTTAKELSDASKNAGYRNIYIAADMTLTESFSIPQNLFICDGVTLTIDASGVMTEPNCIGTGKMVKTANAAVQFQGIGQESTDNDLWG